MTFLPDCLPLTLCSFYLVIFHPPLDFSSLSPLTFQPLSIHMCFNDHLFFFKCRSVPLFKMFELLPIALALIIKCFHCYCGSLQMSGGRVKPPCAAPSYLLTLTDLIIAILRGMSCRYSSGSATYLCVKAKRRELN